MFIYLGLIHSIFGISEGLSKKINDLLSQSWVTNWCHRITLMADTQRNHYRSNVTSPSVTQSLTHTHSLRANRTAAHTHANLQRKTVAFNPQLLILMLI